ncbi:MAG: hypothetical protein QM530_08140 [Phycisphaerales bacterium]|nr:hypothetical protein [Phycisphaerales bacterium]
MIPHKKNKAQIGFFSSFEDLLKGDEMNVLLSAAAFDFKKVMNKWKQFFLRLFQNLFLQIQNSLFSSTQFDILVFKA